MQHQLRTATLRIIRAHDFSRTSNTAVHALVDLLARFLDLVAGTTSEHAQLAGRTSANFYDALMALEEVGIDLDEIIQWRRMDGSMLSEYRRTTQEGIVGLSGEYSLQRRSGRDINDYSDALKVGKSSHHQQPVLFEYREVLEDVETPDSPALESLPSPTLIPSTPDVDMNINTLSEPHSPDSDAFSPAPQAMLPLPNMNAWTTLVSHHPHDHLPPWPGEAEIMVFDEDHHPSLPEQSARSLPFASGEQPFPAVRSRRILRSQVNPHPLIPLYDEPVPYQTSANGHELFPLLPDHPHRDEAPPAPSTHPYLLIAMQTAQENANSGGSPNPARLVISSTLSAAAAMRYNSSDSLFACSSPPPPRNLAPAPSYAVPQNPQAPTVLLPPPQPRSIRSVISDSLDPQPSHLSTHMHALDERVVKAGVQERSTVLVPPTAFVENGKPLLYGRAVRAPWNKPNGQPSRSDRPSGLTDALLFSTWGTVEKKPDEEIAPTR